jgi:hypothetical protein
VSKIQIDPLNQESGILNLNGFGMPWADMPSGFLSFGLLFNMLLFVMPGLVVGGMGVLIDKKKRAEEKPPNFAQAGSRSTGAVKYCPKCGKMNPSEERSCFTCVALI